MMWLHLLLCVCCTFASHVQRNFTVPAAGNALLPCGSFSKTPMNVTWRMEDLNDTWTSMSIKSRIRDLDMVSPTLLVIRNTSQETAGGYSCRTDNDVGANVPVKVEDVWYIYCQAPENWTSLSWLRDKKAIVTAEQGSGAGRMYVIARGNQTFLSIPSVTERDAGVYHCAVSGRQSSVRLYVTQISGSKMFMDDGYWIIVLTALVYVGICCAVMSAYMCRRRESRSIGPKASRFHKVSSTARNLYTDSLNQAHDADLKPESSMYQNFNEVSMKESNKDRNSAASSFMDQSVDADSYLEPNDLRSDHVSEDEDNYENTNEEMKARSEGSQSYEDMMGSVYIKTENGRIQNENEAQEDDADSYENMQAPVNTQTIHYSASLNKTEVEKPAPANEDAKITDKLAMTLATWNRAQAKHDLTQENGDFYLSYENHRL